MRMKGLSASRLTAALAVSALVLSLASSATAATAAQTAPSAAAQPATPAAPIGAGIGGYNAAVLYNGQPQDFYWDQAANSLRHAWYAGGQWNTETLDGPGSLYPGATTHFVGTYTATVVYAGQLHVWYEDVTSGALRHAWYNGSTWSFETLDGPGAPGGHGRTTDQVGQHTSVILYQGQPHVWYYDSAAFTLRHAWWTGTAWSFETLDGPGAPGGHGRTGDHAGQYTAVILYQGHPHVWYRDGTFGSLRHACCIQRPRVSP